MILKENGRTVLVTPISEKDLESIKIGDIVYLSGEMTTCRDVAHRRVVQYGRELPVDIKDAAILHAGPIIRENKGIYEMISVGPTTSMRMEKFEKEFVEKTGVRVLIGKGGMGEETEEACSRFKVIHCIFPAGCAVLAADCVEKIEDACWKELGMPETLWKCRVNKIGPLIVSIDSEGNNLIRNNKKLFRERKKEVMAKLSSQLGYIR